LNRIVKKRETISVFCPSVYNNAMASYFIFDYIKCLQRPSRKNEENINLRNKGINGRTKNVQTLAAALRSPQM